MIAPQPSPEYELPDIEISSFPDRVVSHYLLDSSSIRCKVSRIYSIPEDGVFIEDYGLLKDDSSTSRGESRNEGDIESDAVSLQQASLKRAPSSKSTKDPDLVDSPSLCIMLFLLTSQGHVVRARRSN